MNNNIEQKADKRQQRINSLKKRHIMRMISTGGTVGFAATLLVTASLFALLKRPSVSEIENRTLATFPDISVKNYFSGELAKGIENWYIDTIPGRENLKDLVADIRSVYGFSGEDKVKIHGTKLSLEKEPPQTTAAATTAQATGTSVVTTSTTVATTENPLDDPNINGEISNNILVYQNRGIMLFGGSFENGKTYAEYLNSYKQDLGNVNVYSMVCPTPVSFYLPTKYADMTASEKENIDNINKYLKDVTPVDAISALAGHTDEKIYQNTDHHWSHLGAYYAAEEFAKKAGVPFADISRYDKVVKDGYVGTLYGYTGDSDLKDNPEQFIYYIPKAEYDTEYFKTDFSDRWDGRLIYDTDNIDVTSWYCVFMGSDQVVTHVKTHVNNGRKLCVIKDSYGNALIPWFTSSFQDIYVVDMRYFEANVISKLKEWGVTDLLFAMSSYSATGSNFKNLEVLRTQ